MYETVGRYIPESRDHPEVIEKKTYLKCGAKKEMNETKII